MPDYLDIDALILAALRQEAAAFYDAEVERLTREEAQ